MAERNGTDLPAAVATAWGMRERSGKGPKPGLSLERIIDAGLRVAGAEGLSALSMSRVASELGHSTMSLYRYVSAKDELLALMLDAAWGPPPTATATTDAAGWRDAATAWARAMLARMRQHPWTVEVPLRGLPLMPNEIAWMERMLAITGGLGLTETERMSILLLVANHVRSQATQEAQIAAAFRSTGKTPDEAMSYYANLLRRLATPDRFPAINEVLASGVIDKADGPDDEFLFGLERILDGIAAFMGDVEMAKPAPTNR